MNQSTGREFLDIGNCTKSEVFQDRNDQNISFDQPHRYIGHFKTPKSSELLKIKRQTKTWLQFPLEASLQTIIILPSSSSSSSSSHPSMSHPPLLPDAAILRIKVYLRKSPTSMDTYTELFTSVCCETYDALYTSIYTHTCKLVRLPMIRVFITRSPELYMENIENMTG